MSITLIGGEPTLHPELLSAFSAYVRNNHLGHCGTLGFSWVFRPNRDSEFDVLGKKESVWADAIAIAEHFGYYTNAFNRSSYLGCSMFSPNTYIIGADERLNSCINGVGQTRYMIGDLSDWDTDQFQAKRLSWLELHTKKSCCNACRFLPVCNGGCEFLNAIHGWDCPKKSFEANEERVLITHLGMPNIPNEEGYLCPRKTRLRRQFILRFAQ